MSASNTILLLELLEPTSTVCLDVTLSTSHRSREEMGLFSNDGIRQRNAFLLRIAYPVHKCPLDVRKLALGALDRRNTAILWEQILILLAQNLRYSAKLNHK